MLLLILVFAYHFQILLEERVCLHTYGDAYETYAQDVPRYLLFL
jgi:protein-S-isoprenylcysteine O-methyltransferase Ste14